MTDELRVLIVEDDFVLALHLETIVGEVSPAAVTVLVHSVAGTKEVLQEPFDFAFLDIEVTDGKTFEVAHILTNNGVPFAFVSAASPHDLPDELRHAPFIPKPYRRKQIEQVLLKRA